MNESNGKKQVAALWILGVLVVILIAVIVGLFIMQARIKNQEVASKDAKIAQMEQELTQLKKQNEKYDILENSINNGIQKKELSINDEIVTNAYKFIPTLDFYKSLPTAYQTTKITFNDLMNQIKLINIYNHIDFKKEQIDFLNDEKEWSPQAWFSFDASIMQGCAKKFYGPLATIEHESFSIDWSNSCKYENGKYTHSSGGGGLGVKPITTLTKAYIENGKLYIYDSFLLVDYANDNSDGGYVLNIYNNTNSSTPIDTLTREKEPNFDEFESYFINKYKDKMGKYMHTFELNEEGKYYWVSSEPKNK